MLSQNIGTDQLSQDRDFINGERWAVILDGNYAISDHGRLMRTAGCAVSLVAGNLIRLATNRGGYRTASVCVSGRRFTVRIHSLVASEFVGDRPDGHCVNHKDRVRMNNHFSNLEFATQKENVHHSYHLGFGSAKLSEADIEKIRNMLELGIQQKAIASKFGVTQSNISCIKTGKSRKVAWGHSQ